ncbi:MFS transporter [Iningainema tapete]|nr:MFS transporter [Iningainema tapete]
MQRHTVWIMAICSGAAVANLYYNQPLLEIIQQKFHASAHATGLIPMFTQIGYALGIFLLVPLGDLHERRSLIVTMLGLTTVALAAAAISPSLTWLLVASCAIGITTITAQLIIPLAAQLAQPQERGKVVGMVMSGVLIGILLARTISGFVGASLGWRAMYWLASGLMVVLAVTLSKFLPKSQPSLQVSYSRLIGSLFQLMQQRVLREASLAGAMSFAAFNVFWSTLVFLLAQPPFYYGSEVTGLFGLVGVVGAIAAPLVGRLADKRSPKLTVGLGLIMTTLSFVLLLSFKYQLFGLIVGIILLDLGVQTTMISNQARIYSLPKYLHSRLNAIYVTFYFMGGALGSFLGTYAWSRWQWQGVCLVALMMLAVAFTTFLPQQSNNESQ